MAWINSKLDSSAISVDREELEQLNGGPISDKLFTDADAFIREELSKVRVRFADYVSKYCAVGDEPTHKTPLEISS